MLPGLPCWHALRITASAACTLVVFRCCPAATPSPLATCAGGIQQRFRRLRPLVEEGLLSGYDPQVGLHAQLGGGGRQGRDWLVLRLDADASHKLWWAQGKNLRQNGSASGGAARLAFHSGDDEPCPRLLLPRTRQISTPLVGGFSPGLRYPASSSWACWKVRQTAWACGELPAAT